MEQGLPAAERVTPEPCRWCGDRHGPLCPYVKSYEFSDGSANPEALGKVTRVEFFSPVDLFGPQRGQPSAETPAGDYPRKKASE